MRIAARYCLLILALLQPMTMLQADESASSPPLQPASAVETVAVREGKILVTFNALPAEGAFEVIGPISVHKRWFGGTTAAIPLLANKARELGANAVVETRIWLAPAFPANVAPHGSGIAVRINDPSLINKLADQSSYWE
jgi:hypothetical protein